MHRHKRQFRGLMVGLAARHEAGITPAVSRRPILAPVTPAASGLSGVICAFYT